MLKRITLVLVSQSSVLLTFPLQVSFNKGKVGVPQQRQASVAAFSAIVILIRGIWPQSTSSDPLICNLSELAGVDELTSKTQSDSLTPLSGQILPDSQSQANAVLHAGLMQSA